MRRQLIDRMADTTGFRILLLLSGLIVLPVLALGLLLSPIALVASIIEPEWPTPADRDDFLDSLSDADFTSIFRAAFALNRVPGGDPKDLLAFEQISASDETQN